MIRRTHHAAAGTLLALTCTMLLGCDGDPAPLEPEGPSDMFESQSPSNPGLPPSIEESGPGEALGEQGAWYDESVDGAWQ